MSGGFLSKNLWGKTAEGYVSMFTGFSQSILNYLCAFFGFSTKFLTDTTPMNMHRFTFVTGMLHSVR